MKIPDESRFQNAYRLSSRSFLGVPKALLVDAGIFGIGPDAVFYSALGATEPRQATRAAVPISSGCGRHHAPTQTPHEWLASQSRSVRHRVERAASNA
jgi:hypothetical protein